MPTITSLTQEQSLIMSVFAPFFTNEGARILYHKMKMLDCFARRLLSLNSDFKDLGRAAQHKSNQWPLPELEDSKALKQAFSGWLKGEDVVYLDAQPVSLETIISKRDCQIIVAKAKALYSAETSSITPAGVDAITIQVPGGASKLVQTVLIQQVTWDGLKFVGERGTKMLGHFDDFLVLCCCAAFGHEVPRRVENVWSNGPMEGEFATVRKSVWQCYLQSPRRSA